MSEQDFMKRFWLQVASGLAIIILAAIGSITWLSATSVVQVKENTKKIDKIENDYVKKGDENGIHSMLFENIQNNKTRIEKMEERADRNQQYIVEELDEIKNIIIQKHTK